MRVLVVDIGGTNVKILATAQKTPRKFPSGSKLTPKQMVAGVKELAADWKHDAVAIGYPGRVHNGRIGTGLGAALVADGVVIPMELAHLSFKKGTYEDYVGVGALRRLGRKKWQKYVEYGTARMIEALQPDDVVLGGGNTKKLKTLPKGCRAGNNANAFIGGFRLWENGSSRRPPGRAQSGRVV